MTQLLHPELIQQIPFTGNAIAQRLEDQAAQVADEFAMAPRVEPDMTLAVRALNEAGRLATLLSDVEAQDYTGHVEVVVVDNESSDSTRDVAEEFGATVVNLPRDEFTYPRSLNLCLQNASTDFVYLTVGHAVLSNRQAFRSGMSHFASEDVAGVFARTLPNDNATRTEKLIAVGNLAFVKPPTSTKKASLGVMASQNAIYSRDVWEQLGKFDETYEIGGEDTALAAKMLEQGYSVVEDPLVAAHHTHGLGPINTVRQWKTWIDTVRAPRKLDMDKLARRRPDIDLS